MWVLKCDIKKFFASIEYTILLGILDAYIPDKDVTWLIGRIIDSFQTTNEEIGLPLGNLTSQLFANIYLNELDQYVKHVLKAKYYIRYADDFVIMSTDRRYLEYILPCIGEFLNNNLRLVLHPDKVFISTIASGVDFLGWVHFPDHRVLRTTTKRRMLANLKKQKENEAMIASYLGLLRHGNSWKLQNTLTNSLNY